MKFIFARRVCLERIQVIFVYEGHLIKVKVTQAKMAQSPHSRNVILPLAVTPFLQNIESKFMYSMGFSVMADRMV